MSAISGTWYVSDSMGYNDPMENVPVDYYRFVYATQPDGRKFIVAKAYSGDDSDYQGTARLIAAAPELLAALRALKSEAIDMYERLYPNDESDNDVTAAIDMAIAAIAKAEGRGE